MLRLGSNRYDQPPCPICLQPTSVHDAQSVFLPCCGRFGHLSCLLSLSHDSDQRMPKCLFCESLLTSDHQQMIFQLQKWADKALPWAQQILGSLYVKAPAEQAQIVRGTHLLYCSAEQNNPVAQASIALEYFHKKSYALAYSWYKRCALENEYHIALYNLACLVENGVGCKRDRNLAIGLYKRSAEQGNLLARTACTALENEDPNSTETSEESAQSQLLVATGPQLCIVQ